jgi:signal transduction histidine kinase
LNPDHTNRLGYLPRPYILVTAIALILFASLGIFYALMQPSLGDLEHMALFLSMTATISVALGFGALRLGWLERAPSLRWTLIGTYVLASLLTFINVWITARLMFASEHDLLLATILLFFACGIAVALGGFFAYTLAERIARLETAAHQIQSGNLSERVVLNGRDEIAALGEAFNQMAERLEYSQRKQKELETLRKDLVAWAGHDLRTPLASIRVLVDALVDGVVEDPGAIQHYLTQAQKQVAVLSSLVDDLFQVSQLDAGGLPLQCQTASLGDLISDTLESFSGIAQQRRVRLEGDAGQDIDPLTFDIQLMGRVLDNLVVNALSHTPAGGRVAIRAERTSPREVRVTVSDTGQGIAPEDLPHIFERFYRVEKSRSRASGGAGLGLAIAKGIVEAHGGKI